MRPLGDAIGAGWVRRRSTSTRTRLAEVRDKNSELRADLLCRLYAVL
jgi:hypothetical protein